MILSWTVSTSRSFVILSKIIFLSFFKSGAFRFTQSYPPRLLKQNTRNGVLILTVARSYGKVRLDRFERIQIDLTIVPRTPQFSRKPTLISVQLPVAWPLRTQHRLVLTWRDELKLTAHSDEQSPAVFLSSKQFSTIVVDLHLINSIPAI